eukprot:gene8183-9626_t
MALSTTIPAIVVPLVFAFIMIIVIFKKGVKVIKEREVMVIERFGTFHNILHAGVHFIIPFVDRPKTFFYSFYVDNPITGTKDLREDYGLTRISTQNEVIDLPKQNVTGSLEIDQIIEEAASLNVLTGLMGNEAMKWGVEIIFVKVQKVEALGLTEVLAKKKNADLKNKETIITAKASKQTKVIESEGQRDSMIKKAEGAAQEIISKAKGSAQAKINAATAEVRNIKEIARAVNIDKKSSLDVSKYILSLRYIDSMKEIFGLQTSSVNLLAQETTDAQSLSLFGLTTVVPPASNYIK